MGATLKRCAIVLLAALALGGCGRRRAKAQAWVWPGSDRFNTLLFA